MGRPSRRRATVRLVASFLGAALGTVATPGFGHGDAAVSILRPSADEPLFGPIVVEAGVADGICVEAVSLRVDGLLVGTRSAAPFSFQVDVGQENRQHLLTVTLTECEGGTSVVELRSPAIRVDEVVELDLQQLYVTVTDERGRRVVDLPQELFEVRDEGVRQDLVTFAGGSIPFVATLLVDASGSMRGGALDVALVGARAFAAGMAGNDEVQVVLHDDRQLRSSGFRREAEEIVAALAGAEAGDGTAILDRLYVALLELERRQGRRVVVVLSDGWDLHSVVGPDELESLARSSQALIYWVRLAPHGSVTRVRGTAVSSQRVAMSSWRDADGFRQLERRLERVVRRSGGRTELITRLDEIEPVFRDILSELRQQYALGYYPRPRRNDGSWRRVRVDLRRPGVSLRVREGYVDR